MGMSVVTQGDITVMAFYDWFSFVDFAKDRKTDMELMRQSSRRSEVVGGTFYATPSFNDAYKLASMGWLEGAALIGTQGRAYFDKLSSMLDRPFIHTSEDPGGVGFDIGAFISNDPEHWIHIEEPISTGAGRRILRLVANVSADAAIGAQQMINKGIATATVVSLLEMAGFGVELVGFCGFAEKIDGTGKHIEIYTTVKEANEYFQPITLAYALAHPATFRRFAFSVAEGLPEKTRTLLGIPGNYGYPCEASHIGDVYVPSARFGDGAKNWGDTQFVKDWVWDTLKEQGVFTAEVV